MGTSHSGDEFAGKLRKAGDNLGKAEKNAVVAGGNVVKRTFQGVIAAAGAGGPRGVTVKSKQTTSGSHPAVVVYGGPNPGWVAIINSRTQPHLIAPTGKGRGGSLRRQNLELGKGSRGRRSARAGQALLNLLAGGAAGFAGGRESPAINIKGIGPKAWAMHPGTKGKHFVTPAKVAAVPLASREMSKQTVTEFAKAFV